MNFSITNNIFDLQVIINVSIGVVVGIGSANLISNLISVFFRKVTPWGICKLRRRISPLNFDLGVLDLESDTFKTNYQCHPDAHSNGFTLRLVSLTSLNFLYPLSEKLTVVVSIIDKKQKLVFESTIIPGGGRDEKIWRLGEFDLDLQRGQQLSTGLQNPHNVINYPILIKITVDEQEIIKTIIINPEKKPTA